MNSDEPTNPNIEPNDNEENDDLNLNFDDLDSIDEEVIEIDLNEDDEKKEVKTEDKVAEDIIPESLYEAEPDLDVSKHKASGKHALQYDTIFKGKKTTLSEDDPSEVVHQSDNWMPDVTTNFNYEVYHNERYIREKDLKEKVYKVLSAQTDIDFDCNRRKPSRVDFNNYFFIVKTHLQDDRFTNIEVFNELAYYFSDNLMNMFKLLDNKWRNLIISELQEHIGKINSDKTISHKNLPLGSEIEFTWSDPITLSQILITGEVRDYEKVEDDYIYIVNSYENEYRVNIIDITKILNNTKFKYNLNKLNNIDFL